MAYRNDHQFILFGVADAVPDSMEPERNSKTHLLFSELPAYTISVLSHRQKEVSKWYANAGNHRMRPEDFLLSRRGIPYVRGSLIYFECSSWEQHCAGDHQLMLGTVESFSVGSHEEPLVFYQGGYRSLMAMPGANRDSVDSSTAATALEQKESCWSALTC